MRLNHVIGENPQIGLGLQSKPLQTDESALENEVESHLRNLEELVERLDVAARNQPPFSGKPHTPNLVSDLRAKTKASQDMVRVAKLLSETVRKSMFLRVRDFLNDLEEVIASH